MTYLLPLQLSAILLAALAVLSGFPAAVFLLPLLALFFPVKIAILIAAGVSLLQHLALLGFFPGAVRWRLVAGLGLTALFGAILGALMQAHLPGDWLRAFLGTAMVLMGLNAFRRRPEPTLRPSAPVTGLLSGVLDGMIGLDADLRRDHLTAARLPRESALATAAAAGLLADLARLPLYLHAQADEVLRLGPDLSLLGALGLVGALLGLALLFRFRRPPLRRLLGAAVVVLGLHLLVGGI